MNLTSDKAIEATRIARTLREHGYSAYLVGGCVRDLLLNREPADYDVATSATPDEVIRIFPQTFAVGAQFGVDALVVNVAIPVWAFRPLQGGMVFVPLARTFVAASRQRVARIRHRGTLVLVEGCVIQIAGLAVLVLTLSIVSTPRLPVFALGLTIFG